MESQDRKEEKLLDELETMYQRVAESENSEADRVQKEALQSYYESLQVSHDAPLETIQKTYERLAAFWEPGQFADNPPLREEAERRLAEITHAYEKILASRQSGTSPPSAEPTEKASEKPARFTRGRETGHHFPRAQILLGGSALVVVLLAAFFWPTLYHYATIPSGDRAYQVRTNRLTGSMTYFDGGEWKNPPVPGVEPSALPALLSALAPPANPPERSAKQPIAAPPTKPGPIGEPAVALEKEPPFAQPPVQPAETKGYAIQVGAVRDLNMAEEFVETQKKSGQPLYLAKIRIKDRGVWYRICLGHFASRAEAARYMEEKKIKEIYPECFIQRLPG
jgi:septal ring-binding cell division protein DamX